MCTRQLDVGSSGKWIRVSPCFGKFWCVEVVWGRHRWWSSGGGGLQ